MYPFLCYRCFHINSAEGHRCPNCDSEGSGTVIPANSYLAIPEYGHTSLGYYAIVTDASTQVSEEDLVPVKPTREASTQTSDVDLPLEISGGHGYQNCLESDGHSQNQSSPDIDQYSNANQNGITHSNANEGEFPNESYDICSAATLLEVMDEKPATSKQTYVCKQSSLGESEKESSFDKQFFTRRGPKEPIEGGILPASLTFTDSITLESKYPVENSTEKVKDREDKDNILKSFSFCSRGNPSVERCFQEKSFTAISMAQQKPQTSGKLSNRRCENCGSYFRNKWTFHAHMKNYCNPLKILMRRML